ncbi:Ras-related protein Rab-33B [Merluccius polli]|uniref:Ras-related protein Rab-33B n=1 Tax=Merluccius polli TaxID=89951 RepID=A0AA47MCJ9_MERPO|nr:Ras-related protein Rab-33B [Merluccius polli]
MAIENSPVEVFDTVFNRNDTRLSPSSSSQLDHETLEARIFKIIVIGDSNVGKTCLTYRFCGGIFLQNPEATIGVDFREKSLELDGERIKALQHVHNTHYPANIMRVYGPPSLGLREVPLLKCSSSIWDTAGQERFRKSMVEHYYRNVHAVVFVYDVTSLASFENLPEWIGECSRHSVGPMVPRILVGNKCDLGGHREVPTSHAQRLADGYNFPLFETSAKDPAEKEHVDAIFLTLAYRLKSHKPLRLKQPSESSSSLLWYQREHETTGCQC